MEKKEEEKGENMEEFKKRALNVIKYHLQVAESKLSGASDESKRKFYSIKIATLRDVYDDLKAIEVGVNYGRPKKRN